MKRNLALVIGSLALGMSALVMALSAQTPPPPSADPPARPAEAVEPPPKVAASKIVNVTVYPDSALVTREVEVPGAAGVVELVVSPLPERTINSSLYSEGAEGMRVLTTRFRTRPIKENTREEVRKLEDKAKLLAQTAEKIKADIEACKQNMALLGKLENFTSASTQHATEKGKLDADATIALAKYLIDGRGERTKEMVTLQQQLQTNQEDMEFVARKLREMSAGTSRTERDAVIVVDKANNAPGKVKLNYLVDAAQWRPQYKFRAGKDMKDNVSLEYLAAVTQQTGEDWQNVSLVLSTAQPMLNASPPELNTLAVAVLARGAANPAAANFPMGQPGQKQAGQFGQQGFQGGFGAIPNLEGIAKAQEVDQQARLLRLQAQQELNKRDESTGNEIVNYAGALDQAKDLILNPDGKVGKVQARAGRNEGPSVTYHLAARLTVPSRNDEQVLEVTRLEMAPEYFYKAVPVLTPHVYKQANLTNKSKYVLLPGEATMYNGKDFVGRTNLPLVAIGEQFTVGFGTDPQLQVTRQMMDKARTMQGGNQVLRFEYRILISSYKPEKITLQLWDRLPQAENEDLNVVLVKSAPEISKDPIYTREERTHNLLRWDLEVDPTMSGEKAMAVQYEFKLELDKQKTIGSFQSRSDNNKK